MDRRTLLKGIGLGTLASALPVSASAQNSQHKDNKIGFKRAPVNHKGGLEAIYVPSTDGEPLDLIGKQDFDLRILHVNDLHHRLMSSSTKGDTYQMAQIAKLVSSARNASHDNEAVIYVSAGDDHIGSEFDELLGLAPTSFEMSAVYRAYSAAGMDMSVIGNHEYDKQTEIAQLQISQDARFPVLSANLIGSIFDDYHYPYAVGIANGIRIGFIGLTTDEAIYTQTATDPNLAVSNPKEALAETVSILEDYVDVWVILSHLGYNGDLLGSTERHVLSFGDVDVAKFMRTHSSKPASIIGGHTHTVLNEKQLEPRNHFGTASIHQAGAYGRYLGEAIVKVRNGQHQRTEAKLLPVLPGHGDGRVQQLEDYDAAFQATYITPIMVSLQEKLGEYLGRTDNIETISVATNDIDRYTGESAIANFMNDAVVHQSKYFPSGAVDIAVFNATGVKGLPVGQDITLGDIYKMMPYADDIVLIEMTGRQLISMLESNSKRVYLREELTPFGGDQDPRGFLERGFLHFSSRLRYGIKVGENSTDNQLVDVTFDDKRIDQDQIFKVAINSYLANGRGNWAGNEVTLGLSRPAKGFSIEGIAKEASIETGLLYRAELINYIKNTAEGRINQQTGVNIDGRVKVS